MNGEVWYIDTSAFVKVVMEEDHTTALRTWIKDRPALVSCDLLRVEALRAVRRSQPSAAPATRAALQDVEMLRLDEPLLEMAAVLPPASLRSLDALHLAAAISIGSELRGILTYDERMAASASKLGVVVTAPGLDPQWWQTP